MHVFPIMDAREPKFFLVTFIASLRVSYEK
jgi:hypothetical protein